MKQVLLAFHCILLLYNGVAHAQNKHFITSGTIEFERTANMFALMKKKVTKSTMNVKPYYELYLNTQPQFRKLKSTLTFNKNASLFSPIPPESVLSNYYDSPMANQLNIIFSDFRTGNSIMQKDFYERTYLVKDGMRKIKWKITDETRTIAGYKCRRANALVLDSIYVVAFYTDDIHVSGGPESFSGLPGMILGVAVPHENVTWFATKVTEAEISDKTLVPPTKGKTVNNQQLYDEIMKVISAYSDAIVLLKGFLL